MNKRTDRGIDVLLDMKVGKTMRRDAVLKAFCTIMSSAGTEGGRTRKSHSGNPRLSKMQRIDPGV